MRVTYASPYVRRIGYVEFAWKQTVTFKVKLNALHEGSPLLIVEIAFNPKRVNYFHFREKEVDEEKLHSEY